MRAAFWAIGTLIACYAPMVNACGHCVEDKMAAVYDFAVVSKAKALHHNVAFVAIEGTLSIDAKTLNAITDIVRTTEGVARGSVRVSLELAALSFVFDPKRASFNSLNRSLGRQLSSIGLRASEIKILDGSVEVPRTAR